MDTGRGGSDKQALIGKYPFILLLVFLVGLLLVVGFPRRPSLRSILPPLTFFNAFFKRYEFFINRSLKKHDGKGGLLYQAFCRDPRAAGRRLEELIDAGIDKEAYCAPLMRAYIAECGAAKAGRARLNWAHDPGTAKACLSAPKPIAYGGERSAMIQAWSKENWKRFSPRLQAGLSDLFSRSAPAAARFREVRRAAGFDDRAMIVPEESAGNESDTPFEIRFAAAMRFAAERAEEIDLAPAWLSLLYYCEGLDAFLHEAMKSPFYADASSIPEDDWFPEGILYAADTPFGLVVVGGPGDNVYPAGDVFLLIDLGGNDTYFFDECFFPKEQGGRPVSCSTVLDQEGNDIYVGGPGQVAAGVLGFRSILDLDGRDYYRAEALGLGAGFMGLGLLVDAAGDDEYTAGTFSLGAGTYGAGFLLDGGGDDTYRGTGLCQGYGGPEGLGCLVEATGNDLYYCFLFDPSEASENETKPGYAQGCAAALQGEESAGIGLLMDLYGDDCYRCPSVGQGAALGRGVALLLDGKGFDFYNGRDSCQGFGSLGGIGILRDLDGFDYYLALDHSQGAGDEGSIGILMDDAGDDLYLALSSSQGLSHATGTGMLHDKKGDNRFFSKGAD